MTKRERTQQEAAQASLIIPGGARLNRASRTALFALSFALVPTFLGANTARAQDAAAPINLPRAVKTFDIFVGQDKPGPYTLSWKNLPTGGDAQAVPVVVAIDDKVVAAGQYTLDLAAGTLTFSEPLKKTSMARIEYGYDPGVAVRNADPSATPLTVPLLKIGATNLQITTLPGAAGQNSASASERIWVLGMGGKTSFLGGGMTSQLYMSPKLPGRDEDNGVMDRAGMALGYKLGNDRNGVSAQFTRAGQDFAGVAGKAMGMGDASLQKLVYGARLAPLQWMGLSYSSTEARDLTGKGATGQEVMALRLGGVGSAPTLNVSRTEDTLTAATNGAGVTTTTDALTAAAKVGSASIAANAKQTDVDASNDKSDVKVVEASLAVSTSNKTASSQTSVAVSGVTKESATGTDDKKNVEVRVQASPSLTISAQQQTQTITPLTPGKDGAAPTLGEPTETKTQGAKAELTPIPGAKLTTVIQTNTVGDASTSVTDIGAQIGAGKAVDIAGGMVNRSTDAGGAADLNTNRLSLSLRPMTGLTLSGGVIINPQQDNGSILDAKREELGMKAKVGALELGGGYALTTLKDDAAITQAGAEKSGEVSVTLGLRFNPWTRLAGAYKSSLFYGRDDDTSNLSRGLKSYSLGLTHEFGGLLNFTVGGSMVEDPRQIETPKDYKAEARLGVKF